MNKYRIEYMKSNKMFGVPAGYYVFGGQLPSNPHWQSRGPCESREAAREYADMMYEVLQEEQEKSNAKH